MRFQGMKEYDGNGIRRGPWTPEEDRILADYIQKHGHGRWRLLPTLAGLNRSGRSCRLRWTNYLRPDIKRGNFSTEEEQAIIDLHGVLGNKWSAIASHLPGRTDNEIKNLWNTRLRRKLLQMGIDPVTHGPTTHLTNILARLPQLLASSSANFSDLINNPIPLDVMLQSDAAARLSKVIHLLHNIMLQGLRNPATMENQPIRMDSQELQGDAATNLAHRVTEFQSNFTGLKEAAQLQPQPLSSESNDQQLFAASSSSLMPVNIPTTSATPLFLLTSPLRPTRPTVVNPNLTPFDAWGNLMDDDANGSYWSDIMDQTSSQSWPTLS